MKRRVNANAEVSALLDKYVALQALNGELLGSLKACRELALEFGAPTEYWNGLDLATLAMVDAAIAKAESL